MRSSRGQVSRRARGRTAEQPCPRSLFVTVALVIAAPALAGTAVHEGPGADRTLAGRVCDADGDPLADAVVAVAPPSPGADEPTTRPVARTRAGQDGAFRLDRLPPGPLMVTAAHTDGAGVAVRLSEDDAQHDIILTLPPGGALITGRVRLPSGETPRSCEIRAHRYSDDEGVVFYAEADPEGRYALRLPPGTYLVLALVEGAVPNLREVQANRDERIDFTVVDRAPVPDPVLAWIRSTALSLQTTEPGTSPGDLEPLASALASIRILGLGEPSHGSREFIRLLHRLFEHLSADHGFSLVMLEGSFAGGQAADAYVQGGAKTAREAVHALRFRETGEIIDFVEWMKETNRRGDRRRPVHLVGLDINPPAPAAREALDALETTEPLLARTLRDQLGILLDDRTQFDVGTLDSRDQEITRGAVSALQRALDQAADGSSSADGTDWDLMAQLARNVVGNVEMQLSSGLAEAVAIRDEAMADNALWSLQRHGPDARAIILAHNSHANLAPHRLGASLRDRMGDGYLALGSVFDRGSFLALEYAFGAVRDHRPQPFAVGPSPQGSLGNALARAGIPIAFVDLRRLPREGPVAEWFRVPRRAWSIGVGFFPRFAPRFLEPVLAPEEFDALLFVEQTTPQAQAPASPP